MFPNLHGLITERGPTVYVGDPPIPSAIRGISIIGPQPGTSHVISKPAGTLEGDLLDLTVFQLDPAMDASCPEFPFLGSFASTNTTLSIDTDDRVAVASEPAGYTITTSSPADTVAVLVAYKGDNNGGALTRGLVGSFQVGTSAVLFSIDSDTPPPSTQILVWAAYSGGNPVELNTPRGYHQLAYTGANSSVAVMAAAREWPRFFFRSPDVDGPTDPATEWAFFATGFRQV